MNKIHRGAMSEVTEINAFLVKTKLNVLLEKFKCAKNSEKYLDEQETILEAMILLDQSQKQNMELQSQLFEVRAKWANLYMENKKLKKQLEF